MPAWPASVSNRRRSDCGEAGRRAEPVAQQHHADQARLAGDRRDRGLEHSVLVQVGGERRRRGRAIEHDRVLLADAGAQRGRELLLDGLHRLGDPADAERRAQRRLRAGAEEDDLRRLHAEGLARALEQVDQRGLDVGRAAERAGDAVEELERLVLVVLGEVGAVGEDQDRGGREDRASRRASPARSASHRPGRCSCW